MDQQPAQITRIDGGILTQEADITTVAKANWLPPHRLHQQPINWMTSGLPGKWSDK